MQASTHGRLTKGRALGVLVLASLAVVLGVHQYQRHIRAKRINEANEMLDRLKKGSYSYYTTPWRAPDTGVKLLCQW